MATSRIYHALNLDIATQDSDRICYIILPERLKESELLWLDQMADSLSCNLVVISGCEWNDDLTPWKAPGLKDGMFLGKGQYFLEMLKGDLFFNLEIALKIRKARRSLVGVSLSGLFAVWSTGCMPLFEAVGSVSGSLWYDEFLEWMKSVEVFHCNKYYFSLGEKEKDGKNKRLASVEESTLEATELLKSAGKDIFFEYNEGNHFGPLIERIEKAITKIMN